MLAQTQQLSRQLRHVGAVILRWLWFLSLSAVLAAVGAYVVSQAIHPVYQATTLVIVDAQGTGDSSYTGLLASDQLVVTYKSLITQPVVLQKVASQVGGVSASELAQRLNVSDQAGTQIIQIQVEDTSPTRAALLANTVASAFISVQQDAADTTYLSAEQELMQKLSQASGLISSLSTQIAALQAKDPTDPQIQSLQHQLDAALSNRDSLQSLHSQLASQHLQSVDSVRVFQPAIVPTAPDHPRPLLNAEIAGALGLAIAGSLVFLIELLDDRIRSTERLTELVGAPLLTMIRNQDDGNMLLAAPKAKRNRELAANFGELDMNLRFMAGAEPIRTLAVTSARSGEGKTMTAINLAITLAQHGRRVLLIDANLTHPQAHHVLGLPNVWGLSMWLANTHTLTSISPAMGIPNLNVVTSGPTPPNPTQLLGTARMHELLSRVVSDPAALGNVGEDLDVVVVDTPALDAREDAALVAGFADGVVLVVDANHAHEGSISRAKETLMQSNARIVGVVLNRARVRRGVGQETYERYDENGAGNGQKPENGVALLAGGAMTTQPLTPETTASQS